MAAGETQLKRNLFQWQIIFIVLSAVIGNGIFYNDGEALEIAGPGGLIMSVILVGLITICVMEGVSEFIQLFPAPNAIVEYIRAFVDEDLAWLVGIAYWYTYAALFAAQNVAAAQHSRFWGLSQTWQTIVFYVVAPIVMLVLNLFGVFFYGVVESVGGVLKVFLILGVSFFLYAVADKENISPSPISAGFQNQSAVMPNHKQAFCYVLPLVTFSFLGVELVAVTAYEARDKRALRIPSRIIAYVVLLLYFLCAIGQIVNVRWTDAHLPVITDGTGSDIIHSQSDSPPHTSSVTIIAAYNTIHGAMPGFLNGCFIFSTLSAGNTALYVASRTLYGLTFKTPTSNPLGWLFRKLSVVEPWITADSRWSKLFGGVPIFALCVSVVSFAWLPYLQLHHNYDRDALTEIIAVSSSVSCVVVWAALCLAFIRYEAWVRKCDADIKTRFPEYDRDNANYQAKTFFRKLQPLPAYLGLLGCLVIIGFSTATWWHSHAEFSKVAGSLGAPIVLFTLFIIFKLCGLLVLPFSAWKARWISLGNIDQLHERWRNFEAWSNAGDERPARVLQEMMLQDMRAQVAEADEHIVPMPAVLRHELGAETNPSSGMLTPAGREDVSPSREDLENNRDGMTPPAPVAQADHRLPP